MMVQDPKAPRKSKKTPRNPRLTGSNKRRKTSDDPEKSQDPIAVDRAPNVNNEKDNNSIQRQGQLPQTGDEFFQRLSFSDEHDSLFFAEHLHFVTSSGGMSVIIGSFLTTPKKLRRSTRYTDTENDAPIRSSPPSSLPKTSLPKPHTHHESPLIWHIRVKRGKALNHPIQRLAIQRSGDGGIPDRSREPEIHIMIYLSKSSAERLYNDLTPSPLGSLHQTSLIRNFNLHSTPNLVGLKDARRRQADSHNRRDSG